MADEYEDIDLGDDNDNEFVDEIDDEEDTGIMSVDIESTDNVGETSVEINVEELIAELEADKETEAGQLEGNPRKRLEAVLEERRAARELEEIEKLDEFALD